MLSDRSLVAIADSYLYPRSASLHQISNEKCVPAAIDNKVQACTGGLKLGVHRVSAETQRERSLRSEMESQ